MRTALLAGASGLVGSQCLAQLLADNYYDNVTILVREKLKMEHPKLTQLVVDFNKLENCLQVLKPDHVYCCLGTTIKKAGSQEAFRKVDYEYPLELARISSKNGAQQFSVITALGSNKNSSIFYSRVKGELEEDLKKIPFKGLTILRPSFLKGDRKEKRGGEKFGLALMWLLDPVFRIGPLKNYRAVDDSRVARVMIAETKKERSGVKIISNREMFDAV